MHGKHWNAHFCLPFLFQHELLGVECDQFVETAQVQTEYRNICERGGETVYLCSGFIQIKWRHIYWQKVGCCDRFNSVLRKEIPWKPRVADIDAFPLGGLHLEPFLDFWFVRRCIQVVTMAYCCSTWRKSIMNDTLNNDLPIHMTTMKPEESWKILNRHRMKIRKKCHSRAANFTLIPTPRVWYS